MILFLSDVDGTLINGAFLEPAIVDKTKQFVECGNLLALASGRHSFSISGLTERLPVNFPCAILSGAALYDPISQICCNQVAMPEKIVEMIARILCDYPPIGVQVFTSNDLFNMRLNPFLREHGIAEEIIRPAISIEELVKHEILKVGLCCEDTRLLDKCVEDVLGNEPEFQWHYSHVISGEISSVHASKGAAIKNYLHDHDIHPTIIAAAGDSENDISLLDIADIVFAPENALPMVKNMANIIIPPPEQSGVVKALSILMQMG